MKEQASPLNSWKNWEHLFFTTKESGTGLGLAICYRIAARHNAAIEVSTSPQGTTFSIKFNQ